MVYCYYYYIIIIVVVVVWLVIEVNVFCNCTSSSLVGRIQSLNAPQFANAWVNQHGKNVIKCWRSKSTCLWPASCFASSSFLNFRCAPSMVVTVMGNRCLSADKSSPCRRSLSSLPDVTDRIGAAVSQSGTVSFRRISHPTMLDNEEFTRPRELTQNPLRKIWMPCKNGHIVQRRGKEGAAGRQMRQMMRAAGDVRGLHECTNTFVSTRGHIAAVAV